MDIRSGFGTMTYPNKDLYKGYWENNKRHGNGKYLYANKNCY